jgi:hypothetical protein
MLQLADELTAMHAGLQGAPELFKDHPLDRLLTGAEFLRQAHKFITSAPVVVQRARMAALLEGYTSATKIVRAFAADLQREQIFVPASKALESLAGILDVGLAEYSGASPAPPERPKPKLVIN